MNATIKLQKLNARTNGGKTWIADTCLVFGEHESGTVKMWIDSASGSHREEMQRVRKLLSEIDLGKADPKEAYEAYLELADTTRDNPL